MATKNCLSFGSNIGFDTDLERSSIHFYYYYYHQHLFRFRNLSCLFREILKKVLPERSVQKTDLIQQLSVIWRITFESK